MYLVLRVLLARTEGGRKRKEIEREKEGKKQVWEILKLVGKYIVNL